MSMTFESDRALSRSIFKPVDREVRKGFLVQVEGVDGSGKTSVLNDVRARLTERGIATTLSNWNEATELYNLMMRLNREGELTSRMRCIFGAAELAARQQFVIEPALARGGVVFLSKYLVSLMAHSLIRGHDRQFLRKVYDFALTPDLTLYFDLPPEIALERKRRAGHLGFWESGLDLTLPDELNDALRKYQDGEVSDEFIARSFLHFQSKLREYHLEELPAGAIRLDSRRPVDSLVEEVVRIVEERLADGTRREDGGVK